MDLGLTGKVALVTGASSGIGRAIAEAFGREGARVAITYRQNLAGARSTAESVARAGGEALAVPLDLSEGDSIRSAVERITQAWGGVDVLVNNAVEWPGFAAPGEAFETAPPERFARSLTANLGGPYLLSRAIVGHMRARGWGRIVHVSTGLVEDGFPASAAYIAAKSGLHGLARVMSRELAASGILTNVVMPGFTPGEREVPAPLVAQVSRAAAVGRVTDAAEVARLVVFLCSEANTNVTGELLRADGHFLAPAAPGQSP